MKTARSLKISVLLRTGNTMNFAFATTLYLLLAIPLATRLQDDLHPCIFAAQCLAEQTGTVESTPILRCRMNFVAGTPADELFGAG